MGRGSWFLPNVALPSIKEDISPLKPPLFACQEKPLLTEVAGEKELKHYAFMQWLSLLLIRLQLTSLCILSLILGPAGLPPTMAKEQKNILTYHPIPGSPRNK